MASHSPTTSLMTSVMMWQSGSVDQNEKENISVRNHLSTKRTHTHTHEKGTELKKVGDSMGHWQGHRREVFRLWFSGVFTHPQPPSLSTSPPQEAPRKSTTQLTSLPLQDQQRSFPLPGERDKGSKESTEPAHRPGSVPPTDACSLSKASPLLFTGILAISRVITLISLSLVLLCVVVVVYLVWFFCFVF